MPSFSNKNSFCVLEISDSELKWLFGQVNAGQRNPTVFFRQSLGNAGDLSIQKILSDSFSAKKIVVRDCVLLLNRRLVFLKNFRLPSHSPFELKKMIEMQLLNNLPFAKETLIWESVTLKKNPDGYSKQHKRKDGS